MRVTGNSEPRVRGAAERIASRARRMAAGGEPVEVVGPAPAPIARVRGKHRWQLLLRAADHAPLHRVARTLAASHEIRGVQLALDVDPVSLL